MKQNANVLGFEIRQLKDMLDRQIELCPTLKHDSLHYQNIKVQLLKKECEEEKSMLAETQDGRQELEVTENNLKQVTKVNNEEMMEFKHEILNLSTVCHKFPYLCMKIICFSNFELIYHVNFLNFSKINNTPYPNIN